MMKLKLPKFTGIILLGAYLMLPGLSVSAATFNSSLIMDDTVFNNVGSMNANQIDTFLNSQSSSCISSKNGFTTPDLIGYTPQNGYSYGSNVSAGKAINHVSEAYGLNPQVLLATLQKEQSLVTGTAGCHPNSPDPTVTTRCDLYGNGTIYNCTDACQYSGGCMNIAVGYGCPYYCNADQEGFSRQLVRAAWMLKFAQQRSEGNTAWNVQLSTTVDSSGNTWVSKWDNSDDPLSCYSGNMAQGTFMRCANGTPAYYDGYATIDGTSIHLDAGATVALYRFTPHFSGNQSFFNIFTTWFGGTVSSTYYSCHGASNVSTAPTGERIVSQKINSNSGEKLTLVIPNNTGSSCIETHTWADSNYQNWVSHIASNAPAVDGNDKIISASTSGGGADTLYKVDYQNTSSGHIEVHGWDSTTLHWTSHIATNRPSINPADAKVIAADLNGDGKDELYLVQLQNTSSGKVEVHGWTSDLQNWSSHIATNLPAFDPTTGTVMAADLNGDGKDELVYVKFGNAQSSKVEFHTWSSDLQNWTAHVASNLPSAGYSITADDIVAADTNNAKKDELLFIKYSGTDSAKVEVHGWTSDLQNWSSHIATSEGSF